MKKTLVVPLSVGTPERKGREGGEGSEGREEESGGEWKKIHDKCSVTRSDA